MLQGVEKKRSVYKGFLSCRCEKVERLGTTDFLLISFLFYLLLSDYRLESCDSFDVCPVLSAWMLCEMLIVDRHSTVRVSSSALGKSWNRSNLLQERRCLRMFFNADKVSIQHLVL